MQLAILFDGGPVAALQVGKRKTAGHFQLCNKVNGGHLATFKLARG